MYRLKRSDIEGWNLSIRTTLLPKDTNYHGTIFGGVILSLIDIAGAIEARRYCDQRVVTVSMNEVVFKEPVFVGDLISFYTRIIRIGRTSITVDVFVIATRETQSRKRLPVTEATVTYVAIDENRDPSSIVVCQNEDDPPALALESEKN
ncbi:MAG: acyl-CoA thioesterase [Acidobacteria bacterium]|nr:MAG: acyl-CoA thioesterase [Acidobacteriota bacterium]